MKKSKQNKRKVSKEVKKKFGSFLSVLQQYKKEVESLLKKRWGKYIIIFLGFLLFSSGTALALNGFFGGGNTIPEDTMTRDLAGHWSFDEGSGTTAYDTSENGNNGTLINDLKWTKGKKGGAVEFDGRDGVVNVDNCTLSTDAFTVLFWYKTDQIFGSNDMWFHENGSLSYGRQGTNDVQVYAYLNAPNDYAGLRRLRFGHLTHPTSDNEWHLRVISVYVENGTAKADEYEDGEKLGSTHTVNYTGNTSSPSGQMGIGSCYGGSSAYGFVGKMDDVKIYNRKLSAEEIRYHYNRGGPLLSLNFDEGSGATVYDASDNHNNGTLTVGASGANTATSDAWVKGIHGSALNFDGTDDYASVPFSFKDSETFSVWVKTSTGGTIIDWSNGVNNGYHDRQLYINGDGSVGWYIWNKAAITTSGVNLKDNSWHHVSATGDIDGMHIFVDGIQRASRSGDSRSDAVSDTTINIGSFTGGFFTGTIDDVRIYDYARTPEEIRLDYNAGFSAKFGPSNKSCSQDPASCMDYGLVGNWSFDEGRGVTAYDVSNNNNDGTLINDPKWVKGKKGGALEFDGVDDYVEMSDTDSSGISGVMTAEAWIKLDNLTGDRGVIFKGGTGGWQRMKLTFSSGSLFFERNTTDGYKNVISGNTLAADTWVHVVGIYDGTYMKLFENGVEVKSANVGSNTIPFVDQPFVIGNDKYSGGRYFDGLIDEVRIYNRALSDEEIRYHYNRGGPVLSLDFDEGSGATIYDASGNNNDGTLTVGATGANTTTSDAWVKGVHGSALNFDGTDDEVNCGSNIKPQEAVSYSAWINPSEYKTARIIDVHNNSSIRIAADGRVAFVLYGVWEVFSSDVTDLNKWTHFEATYNKNEVKIYLNGELNHSEPKTNNFPTSNTITFIGSYSGCQFFNGFIDNARIYDYARTPDEIRLDYNAGYAVKLGPSGKSCSQDPASCMDYGLVGNWSMDEGSGTTAYDASGNDNDGTLNNDPKWVKGKKGVAVEFDGVDDYVEVATGLPTAWSDLTYSIWLKPDILQNEISFVQGTDYAKGFSFYIRSDGNITFCYRDSGTTNHCFDASSAYSANEWVFITFVFDSKIQKVIAYINGTEKNSADFTDSILSNNAKLRIGSDPYFSGHDFDGSADDFRIYDRALSAEEVRYHYNRGAPVVHWNFNEGEGNIVYDSTENNNDGTLINDPTWVEGKHGSALSFDRVDDYVNIGDLGIDDNYTAEAWIKADALTGPSDYGNYGFSVMASAAGGAGYPLWLLVKGTEVKLYAFTSNISGYGMTTDAGLTTGKWFHIVGTATKSGEAKIYVNGVEKLSFTADATNFTNIFTIGDLRPGRHIHFDGLIDDVKIYNYIRTPEQILVDYNAGYAIHLK